MKKMLIWIFLILILLINAGCPKPCIEVNYSFVVHAQINPDIDSVNIGDTIFLSSTFPTKLNDQNTSAKVDYSGSTQIGATLGVYELISTDTLAKDAVFNFDYFSIMGWVYNDRTIPSPDGTQQLSWAEPSGRYELNVGLIPKVSGVYVLTIGNGISNGQKDGKNCSKASFNITLENTAQHFYLLYNWNPNAQFFGDGKSRVYYFKVK